LKAATLAFAFAFLLVTTGAELPKWSPFVESNFPFYSSVLDARKADGGFATNNLSPRAIILNLPEELHVAFDIDLLRVAAIWRGPGVTPVSMAQGSYENTNWGKKAPEGQGLLPEIVGEVWYVNGLYPGVRVGKPGEAELRDPRPPNEGAFADEYGRGPLPGANFRAVQLTSNGVTLEYEIDGVEIRDQFYLGRDQDLSLWFGPYVSRRIIVEKHDKPLTFVTGAPVWEKSFQPGELLLAPSTKVEIFSHDYYRQPPAPARPIPLWRPSTKRWPERITTTVSRVTTNDAYRIEHIGLPLENPWHRNVRLADIAFFSDGRAAGVTFDGDVWIIDGLSGDLQRVRWRRFASGLHEPLALAIRNDEIFVFDRNGIWKILDTDGNGEADRHELFCNRFTQTAETREFASSMKLLPDGGFVIAKPGQSGSTVGRDSGKVLRVSADGKRVIAIGQGFRQPFLGVNPRTGLITASDQQGNYVPTTPLYIVRDDQYYGFRPTILPLEKSTPPIADPLVLIPHAINASAAGQVWLGDNMGPLSNTMLLLGYYRSEIFSVLWNGGPNAAVVSFTRDLQFPPLNATIHPLDHSLFVAGFQIWGGMAPEISGLARITYIGGSTALPREVLPMREGVLVSFHTPVALASVRPENFFAERWEYRRSHEYGSAHYKLDGSKGQETLFASNAYLSDDHKSIFVGIPDMRPVQQLRFGWSLAGENGMSLQQNAYLTPRELESFKPEKHGFQPLKVDLTPRTNVIAESTPITVEEGKRLAELMGCVACHSADGSTLGKVGPTWKNLAGSRVRFTDGTTAIADSDYLRESIRKPTAKIVKDYDKSDAGMPSYEGVLTDPQIEALVLYIESLR
jgi:mono/diheme cytochrome c family protein